MLVGGVWGWRGCVAQMVRSLKQMPAWLGSHRDVYVIIGEYYSNIFKSWNKDRFLTSCTELSVSFNNRNFYITPVRFITDYHENMGIFMAVLFLDLCGLILC